MRSTWLKLDVKPRGVPDEMLVQWSEMKRTMGAKLRRGSGSVMTFEQTFYGIRFSEVWAYDWTTGLAVYTSGDTDADAIGAALKGEWIEL